MSTTQAALLPTAAAEPVECLGLVFANDEQRRAYFLEDLRRHLQDPAFRAVEGFPLGADEDILALSDPPYYTACPNPFLPQILAEWQAQRAELHAHLGLDDSTYHREPFAADVSEGRTDPIYTAHSYHTKVPHKAIMRYILHYTEPGDIVFDGFCGTGMTGVAAQLCGDRKTVESLGYRVDSGGVIYAGTTGYSRLGARKAVLNDLSTAATFIGYNYNIPTDLRAFERQAKRLLTAIQDQYGWMYQTLHSDGQTIGQINFTVWSEVFSCPDCGNEVVYYDVAFDQSTSEVLDSFSCPHCNLLLDKKSLVRTWHTYYDESLRRTHQLTVSRPVLINYQVGNSRYEKKPDPNDLALLERIETTQIEHWYPAEEMLDGERKGKDGYHLKGITHLPHFYLRRPLIAYAKMWDLLDDGACAFTRFFVQGNNLGFTKMNRYSANHFSQVNRYFSGTLFVASLISEVSPNYSMSNKLRRLIKLKMPGLPGHTALSTQSTTSIRGVPDGCVDYCFVDPPFGNNLHYSELNFFWEAWLRVLTQREPEAVMDKGRNRTLEDYQDLMAASFQEIYRVLKQGRWLTVEFHNSRNSVWNAIQEAMLRAGFIVADTRVLDKQQETYKQSIQKLVKQDLVISAYKPTAGFAKRFQLTAGTEEGVWDFVREHLGQLPPVVGQNNVLEINAERQDFLLFDRMVAYHIQRGVAVPISAAQFYAGLRQRFTERDGMFFLPDQVAEYDKARLEAERVERLVLFVTDEKSAITWLRMRLGEEPQSFSDIQPQFLQELHQARHEDLPDLRVLLTQNFIQDDLGRWYPPDPARAEDLERLRRRDLLAEFDRVVQGRGRITSLRTEAARAGFAHAYAERNYALIVQVAERLPDSVLQEDPDLLMYYDNASLRV